MGGARIGHGSIPTLCQGRDTFGRTERREGGVALRGVWVGTLDLRVGMTAALHEGEPDAVMRQLAGVGGLADVSYIFRGFNGSLIVVALGSGAGRACGLVKLP